MHHDIINENSATVSDLQKNLNFTTPINEYNDFIALNKSLEEEYAIQHSL